MFDDISPTKKAAAFMAFMFMAGLLVFSKGLLPYYDYLRLLSDATMESEATIISVDEIVEDDIYFYGPTVEFMPDGFMPVHSDAINTVKSRHKFSVGDAVTIRYDGTINSDVLIVDDKTCVNNLILLSCVGGVMALIGLVDFVYHAVNADKIPKGEKKKFKTTPDGLSFEEWQQLQRMEELRSAASEAGDDPAADEESSKEV